MAAELYSAMQVKNTFLEFNLDDSELSDLNIDDDEGPKRQVTEPTPSTIRLLDFAKQQTVEENTSTHSTDYDKTEDSTASSEHDPAAVEPFQPECEPDFSYDGTEMDRQVTEELCFNVWESKVWEPDVEVACLSPHLGHMMTGPYLVESHAPTLTAAALFDHREFQDNQPIDRCTSKQTGTDSDATNKAKIARRRKRESLIDIAARKQKQDLRQAKQQAKRQAKQQRNDQSMTNARHNKWGQGDAATSKLAKVCPQCGGECQMDYKFCRFCGSAVAA